MTSTLIRPLAEGPLDIIGDVHGEREALEALLGKLGYIDGRHPDARRLVFVGDLCDRGPDSPGVIRQVQSLVDAGQAQVIAGNHELNLLRREKKHGNHWFFGETFRPKFGHCVAVSPEQQEPILSFFRSLPIALERSDLRIVHATWIDSQIDACRKIDKPLDAAYQDFDAALERLPAFAELRERHDEAVNRLGDALGHSWGKKAASAAGVASAIGPFDEFNQMGNPIRVITSGVERATLKPFFASDKWRYVDRLPWWHEYKGNVPVLFGHYWRWWNPSAHASFSKGEPQLFTDDPVAAFMAEHEQTFCIDFSVGSRFKQRLLGHKPPYQGRLAALQWPERTLVFDGDDPDELPLEELQRRTMG
jgi:hypothetical protein